MPSYRRLWLAPSDPSSKRAAELERPSTHRIVGYIDASLSEQVLDIAIAQGEPKVEPDRMLDDGGREPVTGMREFIHADFYRHPLVAATGFT